MGSGVQNCELELTVPDKNWFLEWESLLFYVSTCFSLR